MFDYDRDCSNRILFKECIIEEFYNDFVITYPKSSTFDAEAKKRANKITKQIAATFPLYRSQNALLEEMFAEPQDWEFALFVIKAFLLPEAASRDWQRINWSD